MFPLGVVGVSLSGLPAARCTSLPPISLVVAPAFVGEKPVLQRARITALTGLLTWDRAKAQKSTNFLPCLDLHVPPWFFEC